MTPLPTAITHDQHVAALQALGLDPALVTSVRFDVRAGTFLTVFVRSPSGNIVVDGDGQAVTARLHIPFPEDLPGCAPADS
ncbi:hypothetical protein ACFWP2_20605 [Kitasatospora sp. NPDC058444]|uniref:hypothetical protein n=1 Tax=Kitasatospora sp. NPDC058444 TaxID=3346504 RepID=UPI003656DD4B